MPTTPDGNKFAPWGPLTISNSELVAHRLTIPGLTFLFISRVIEDVDTYKAEMKILMRNMRGSAAAVTFPEPSQVQPYARMQKAVNKKVYGKTALQCFIAMENALYMTRSAFPEVIFRTHLPRTMQGIDALHAVCGSWIDVDLVDDWGLNIAGCLTYFRANFYTKIVAETGCISYEAAPVVEWIGKKDGLMTPVNNPLFDFIHLLWPTTSIYATADPVKMIQALDRMQFRENKLKNTDHFNPRTAFSNLRYIGTEVIEGEQKKAVDDADSIMIPYLETIMNATRIRMSV